MNQRSSFSSKNCDQKRKSEFPNEHHDKKLKTAPWSLSVREPRHYVGRFDFSVLYECGNFSVDGKRSFVNDQSQLKYIHLPTEILKAPLDLNLAYENAARKPSITNEKLDLLLKWILAKNCKGSDTDPCGSSRLLKSLHGTDFICFRGLLKTILTTPYERNEDWIICATKFKGNIYLVAFPTEQRCQREANMTEREKKMCAWGYKFEQYLTKSHPNGHPEPPNVPVNENEEYCVVFKSQLNSHVLMYGAEVDGFSDTPSNDAAIPPEIIELKTSRVITRESHNRTFQRYKTLNWWSQSYLVSAKKIHCGFRDDAGVIQHVRSFSLPELVDLGKGFWSPDICFNFASRFLSFVKSIVVKDDPNVIYKFDWAPGSSVTCQELHSTTSPEFQILPDWYLSEFEPQRKL